MAGFGAEKADPTRKFIDTQMVTTEAKRTFQLGDNCALDVTNRLDVETVLGCLARERQTAEKLRQSTAFRSSDPSVRWTTMEYALEQAGLLPAKMRIFTLQAARIAAVQRFIVATQTFSKGHDGGQYWNIYSTLHEERGAPPRRNQLHVRYQLCAPGETLRP